MFSKSDFLESLENETTICKHLLTKLPEGKLDYRPSDNQRSTLELLQYLTISLIAPVKGLINRDFSHLNEYLENAKSVTAENFCAKMDQQLLAVTSLIDRLSDEDLQKETALPNGVKTLLGKGLVNYPLKFIAAYRLQLFVNVKATGAADMSTMNAWFGMDKPAG